MSDSDPEPGVPFDPGAWIKKLTESYRSVRFPRGVVGKTTQAMLALLGVWVVIVWQLSDNLYRDIGLILAGLVATGVFVWWTNSSQRFAERNPAQAMLDGAEFLEYHKFEAQAKGLPPATQSPRISDPTQQLPIIGTTSVAADE
jgi:hypothetical protein